MMNISEVIDRFSNSGALSVEEIRDIVRGAGDGTIPESELSQFLLAVLAREKNGLPLSDEQAAVYTESMARSGLVFDWSELELPVAARHTPGCVGDTQSGPVDAILRACDIASINLTGKRLIHTPGTVERFCTIPGFNCSLSPEQVRAQMKSLGMVITGQTPEIAPADGRLYALRDKIGAVQCMAHICASVMSKKIASGPKFLSLTVTYGPAAIMNTFEEASRCAAMMVGIGQQLGVTVGGDMFNGFDSISKMLGTGVLGMKSCIRLMRNEAPRSETEVTLRSAAPILLAAGKAETFNGAIALASSKLRNGEAIEWFRKLVEAQGGDANVVDQPDKVLGTAQVQKAVFAQTAGYLQPNIRELGNLAHELTGPFQGPGWFPQGGIVVSHKGGYGDYVGKGDPLCVIHARDLGSAAAVFDRVSKAFRISSTAIPVPERFSALPSVN